MNLSKLIAISGKSGIYKVVSNRSNGLVVEDIDTGKKRFVSGRIHQFTPLESISIYTQTDTAELKTVFTSMLENYASLPPVTSKASAEETRDYFETILPDYDPDRVYLSDIKKLIKWFNFLNERNLLSLEEPTDETASEEEE